PAAQHGQARPVGQHAVAEDGPEQGDLDELDDRVQVHRLVLMDREKSSRRSCGSSRPVETRTVPGVMPSASRSSGDSDTWDVMSGYEMVVSTPARLAAKRTIRSSRSMACTAGRPPARSKASIPPAPCGSRRRASGSEGEPSSSG